MILATDGAKQFDAYLATPASGSGAAILILSDMFGLNGPMRALADGWAARGHPAMVPNLFWRSDPANALEYEGPDRQLAWERLRKLDVERIVADLSLAVRALRATPGCSGKTAAIGFCAGGQFAFLAAARAGIDAAVSFYALGISKYLAELPRIACPLQLHYGRKDEHVPMAEIDAVSAAVRGRRNVAVYLYDAGHSFFNPVRPTYDPHAANLAQERVDALIALLRAPGS
jgi:carboxymethylenebutenolidase